MSTGLKLGNICGAVMLSVAVLCAGSANASDTAQTQTQTHTKKKSKKAAAPLPTLPSGPTGRPVQQIPLDSIAAVPPQVSFTNNELTIVAPNSTLADILRAVHKQTGAEIDVPPANDRVVTHLGPGPARDVIADLLNGSRFNYVLLGAPGNESLLTRVVLVPKTGPENVAPAAAAGDAPQGAEQAANAPQPDAEQPQDPDADAQADDSGTDDSDQQQQQQPTEAEQQQQQQQGQNGDQQTPKTPQQLLQEMQQRQMQMQNGQGPGVPPRPPQQ